MSEDELKIGKIVQLQSGGAPMTVEKIDDQEVCCVWFERDSSGTYFGGPRRATFSRALITTAMGLVSAP